MAATRKSTPTKKMAARVPKVKKIPRDRPSSPSSSKPLNLSAKKSLWPKTTELLSLEFTLRPLTDCKLYAQYTIGLHAWFLHQIRDFDPELSAYLHDSGSEKPFSLTGLNGQFTSHSRSLQLRADEIYRWRINILSGDVTPDIAFWLRDLPSTLELKDAPLTIESVRLAYPATTYAKLLRQGEAQTEENTSARRPNALSLTFSSPTSFRRRGHHLPLPLPYSVFQSYLRRWNHFAKQQIEKEDFLNWIDAHVIIQHHQIDCRKVAAGKQGSVTGFTGAVTYALDRKAAEEPDFVAAFYALGHLASYCGTGHKTTFGLGETRLGWHIEGESAAPTPIAQVALAERIEELSALFFSQRKRQGGDRARNTADTWATIVARREVGDSLSAIAQDMNLSYETIKTYSKLARRALRQSE